MRKLYVVAPGTPITAAVRTAAAAAGASEIALGIPPRLVREGVTDAYPFVYTEPDDPEKEPTRQAVTVLRNTFKTTRTAAQIDNSLDALTILLRQIRSELKP